MALGAVTLRIYASAQASFSAWCEERNIEFPAPYADVARYLGTVKSRSSVPVHVAAIGALYRRHDIPFDIKSKVLQRVIAQARARDRFKQ
jgi:hypothetical protein